MRKAILSAAGVIALGSTLASPAMAADLTLPRYGEGPVYQREVDTYEYRTAPRVVVEERAPLVSETVVVRRPPIAVPAPVVVEEDEYPVYPAPPAYAYAGPVWNDGWGYRHRFRGRW